MNCKNCHQEIPDGVKFCPCCGAPQEADNSEMLKQDIVETEGFSAGNDAEKDVSYSQNEYAYNYDEQNEPVNWVPYLVLAIISTVCCCVPFGIVSIVYAVKINNAVTAGDMQEAQKSAKTARIWLVAAFVTGILINVLLSVVYVGILGAGNYYYF